MISKKKRTKIKTKSGFALIAVLLFIAVLSAFILEFNYKSRMKLHLVENFHLASQALNNADAGIAAAIAMLRQNENIFADENSQSFLSGMDNIPIEDGFCSISIAAESGKFNINTLCTNSGQPNRDKVNQMLRLIDLLNNQHEDTSPVSYSLIPAIIDWTDYDDDVTILPFVKGENRGAENDYYQKLEEKYPCKNAPFDLLSELMLVKGMTTEIFHGRIEQEEARIKPVLGINQYLTVYGDGKININEASPIVIQSLSDNISFILAQNIVEQRKISRYSSIEQLKQVPGMTTEIFENIREMITIKTNDRYYIVTVTGVVKEFERNVQVVLRKKQSTSQIEILMRSEI
ncbi:MAG: general secretion pathway protein GspK [Sedimentisphaerales bacterium]|nr:general secretion pathway protein GspK [Sedimentisphaerales bacterium]